nr:PREDICTED: glutamate receptor 2.9-like [Daucus carota subsp. sativus]
MPERKETNPHGLGGEKEDSFNASSGHKDSSSRHKYSFFRKRDKSKGTSHAQEKQDKSGSNVPSPKEIPDYICRDKYCTVHRRDDFGTSNRVPNMNYCGGSNYSYPRMNSFVPPPQNHGLVHARTIGGIVDYSSAHGKEEKVAIKMAIEDCCAFVPLHRCVGLHFMNSGKDPLEAAASAKKLIQTKNVSAIIGLDRWEEAGFVAKIGNTSQVPIISLASDIPLSALKQWPFLLNMARSSRAQMKAVAAIVQSWQWRKVTIIYEDTISSVNDIFPYLIEALSEADVAIDYYLPLQPLSPSSIQEKLRVLQSRQSRVFIVHTSSNMAVNIFLEAKRMKMMKKESVWITTDGITSFIDSLNSSTILAMQGVLGVKGFSPFRSQVRYKEFSRRFKAKLRSKYPTKKNMDPGSYALNAYDAVYTAVLAIEGKPNPQSLANILNNNTAVQSGQELLARILDRKFMGLYGEVNFKGGALAPSSTFQIVNVIGRSYLQLGYWSEGSGFSVKIDKGSSYSKSMKILGQVNWPGRASTVPRGWWPVARTANRLKIGVPGNSTFKGFVNVTYEQPGGKATVKGLSIDVFIAVVGDLPYSLDYDFVPYYGSYDSLVKEVYLKTFDAVVGDTSIMASRCEYAEFSQPYSDSGLQVLVYTKGKTSATRAWLFKKPFTTWTWIFTAVINLYSGFVVWFIERQTNRDLRGSWFKQCGTIIWIAFTTLFTSLQGDQLHSNLPRMAAVIWLFVALVITSSYTASLTSLLTIQNLNPMVTNVETLRRTGAKVGCDGNSFVVKYLVDVLKFEPHNIEKIYSEDDYPKALKSGKIAAAFLEVPYIKVLLATNCDGFMTGETFKVGGFGFVFPKAAPLLSDISEAVLKASENGTIRNIENSLLSSYKCSEPDGDAEYSLGLDSFWGLFAITAAASTLALLLFLFPRALPKWPNLKGVVIETEPEQGMHSLLRASASSQHDPVDDERVLFNAELNRQ